MSNWKQIIANSNLIQTSTDKAILIKLPKSELMFWHPAKCVRLAGKNNYRMTISYTDDFKFKAFRNSKGKHNFKDKIEERELTAAQFEEFFHSAESQDEGDAA